MDTRTPHNTMDTLNVITLNVRGLRDKTKRDVLLQFLDHHKVDISFLQETYCTEDFKDTFFSNFSNYNVFHSCSNSVHSRGVSILIRKSLQFKVINHIIDDEGRKLLLNVEINGEVKSLVCAYLPNKERERVNFFVQFTEWIVNNCIDNNNVILGADFNCVLEKIDRKLENKDKSSKCFKRFLEKLEFQDIWRAKNKNTVEFTFTDPSNRGYNSRIDYILGSRAFCDKQIKSAKIIPAPVPDHNAVMVCFSLHENKRGPGYWKLNTSVLKDEMYIEGINKLIDKTVSDYEGVRSKLVWELCKIRIREYSIAYCSEKRKVQRSQIQVLEGKLKKLDANLGDAKAEMDRKTVKHELDTCYINEARGAQIRAKAKYVENGENSLKYFAGLEKQQQKSNTITKLRSETGEVCTKDEELLDIAAQFYDTLYKSKGIAEQEMLNYFDSLNIGTKLTDQQKISIEGKITYKECDKALKQLKPNKSPGLDGLPAEFYQTFWKKISKILVNSYNESYEDGQLTESQRKAVISLIFKKGDAELLSNYRPISLTCVDYKILAFCLANRMQKVIKCIVSPSQVAYIKDRFIGCNIRLIEDVMEYFDDIDEGAVLMMLDFKKAFDTLEWNFLLHALKMFNFGESFIHWIMTLYNDPIACVKNNGHLSRDIHIERSVRQGCPVSVLLYILAVEIMAISIRQNVNILGLQIGNDCEHIKIMQYADDGVLFLKDADELAEAINTINRFSNVAGTVLNKGKCEGLWLGSFKERQDGCNLLDIKWPTEPIRCLGIYIGHRKQDTDFLNWTIKLEKIEAQLHRWKQRDLTVFGKITIIKQLIVPKVLFSVSNLATPDGFVQRLNTQLFDFIWGTRDKVKRNVTINDYDKGGLKMIDIESLFTSVKASWVIRLLQASEGELWTKVAKHYLMYQIQDMIFKCNFSGKYKCELINNLPLFYKEVLTAFNKSKCISHDCFCDNILEQPLWANDYIIVKEQGRKSTLFFRRWIDAGIVKISNLRFIDGVLDEKYVYDTVSDKVNILSEVSKLKVALKPYTQYIGTHRPINDDYLPLFYANGQDVTINEFKNCKSRFFYKHLITYKGERPRSELKWQNIFYLDDCDFKTVYRQKIICIKDRKIAEFNYKLLHDILPCNVNLVKWRKRNNPNCKICNVEETTSHMLYYCKYAKSIWKDFNQKIGFEVEIQDVITGCGLSQEVDLLISLVSYLIYKYWLLESLKDKPRINDVSIENLTADFKHRIALYHDIGWKSYVDAVEVLLKP